MTTLRGNNAYMLLWIAFAILTALVVAALMQPLRQRTDTTLVDPNSADLSVYRAQLDELDAERERGLVDSKEFEAARAEVARRLIKASESQSGDAPAGVQAGERITAQTIFVAVAAFVPIATVGTYLLTGSPHLPAQPFVARAEPTVQQQAQSVVNAINQVEERLRTNPDDGQGWAVIAPVYLRLGRFGDAAHAFAEANRLLGEDAKRLVGFAEATIRAEGGQVTAPVRKAAVRIIELEPERMTPRAWLALGHEQDGNLDAAGKIYADIIARAPADATYRSAIVERLEGLKKKGANVTIPEPRVAAAEPATPPSAAAPRGPTQDDVKRAQGLTPEARQGFINQMVTGLAARLKDNPNDLQGWMRLARSYTVLGRTDEAKSALDTARKTFADDQKALANLDAFETSLKDVKPFGTQ